MYARKDIRTVLPDAVLRCRKLQAATSIELDEMEKTKYRRINNLEWQQQTFQRTINEKHKRWRMYDRAFRLKLRRELGADLAAALRIRTRQEEEQKELYEKQLIEKAVATVRPDDKNERNEKSSDVNTSVIIERVAKSNSAHPKSFQEKVSLKKGSKSAVDPRRGQSAVTKLSQITSVSNEASPSPPTSLPPKPTPRRIRTSRFNSETRRDTETNIGLENDFGSVLFRILSNIAATPDLDDEFTIKKRALEARERRLILTKDDRYYNLVRTLAPQKIRGQRDYSDFDLDEDEQ